MLSFPSLTVFLPFFILGIQMWQKWNYTFLHELVSLSSATIWRHVININISADSPRLSWLFAHKMEFLWFSWIFLSHCQFCRFRCDLIICVFFRLTTFHTIIHAKPPPPHQRRGWLPLVSESNRFHRQTLSKWCLSVLAAEQGTDAAGRAKRETSISAQLAHVSFCFLFIMTSWSHAEFYPHSVNVFTGSHRTGWVEISSFK